MYFQRADQCGGISEADVSVSGILQPRDGGPGWAEEAAAPPPPVDNRRPAFPKTQQICKKRGSLRIIEGRSLYLGRKAP